MEPAGQIDDRFSSPGAGALEWGPVDAQLAGAGVYWLSTVRDDRRPHVTPLIGLWDGSAFVFCTGYDEQKARNLAANPHCCVTTGEPNLGHGTDVVVEGDAAQVTDTARLTELARAYETKYGPAWRFGVEGGGFRHAEGPDVVVPVFEVRARKVLAFSKGEPYSQTRWLAG